METEGSLKAGGNSNTAAAFNKSSVSTQAFQQDESIVVGRAAYWTTQLTD